TAVRTGICSRRAPSCRSCCRSWCSSPCSGSSCAACSPDPSRADRFTFRKCTQNSLVGCVCGRWGIAHVGPGRFEGVSTPTEQMRITPRGLFRTFATAEMITWAGLITALILRAVDVGNFVPIAGGVHGFVFLSYAATTIFVWVNQQWRPAVGFTGLLLAIVPFATVPFDIAIDRRGLLAGGWRLAPGGDEPRGFIEHVQAWV